MFNSFYYDYLSLHKKYEKNSWWTKVLVGLLVISTVSLLVFTFWSELALFYPNLITKPSIFIGIISSAVLLISVFIAYLLDKNGVLKRKMGKCSFCEELKKLFQKNALESHEGMDLALKLCEQSVTIPKRKYELIKEIIIALVPTLATCGFALRIDISNPIIGAALIVLCILIVIFSIDFFQNKRLVSQRKRAINDLALAIHYLKNQAKFEDNNKNTEKKH